MNYKYLATLFLVIGLSNCDFGAIDTVVSKAKEAKQSVKTVKDGAMNLTKIAAGAEDMKKNAALLQKMKPVSKEKIKAWMPTELEGRKREKYSLTTKLGVADITSVSLTFGSNKEKNRVTFNIVDGAGQGVSMISPFLMVQKMQMDVENEKGYQRTEKLDGNNVLVDYKNPPHEKTSMKYVLDDRFLVDIEGKMNPKDLWKLHNKLNIGKLAD